MAFISYSELLELYNDNQAESISDALKSASVESLKKFLDDQIRNNDSTECVEVIRGIFLGCNAKSREHSELILSTIKHCITLLQSTEISSKVSTEIVGVIILELDYISSSKKSEICDLVYDSVKSNETGNGFILHILPKLLSSLQIVGEICSANGTFSGPGYKKHFLNQMCSLHWNNECSLHLTEVFKDVEFDDNEFLFVVQKVLKQVETINVQEIPALVYQLLNLTSSRYEEILYGIDNIFVKKYERLSHDIDSMDLENGDNNDDKTELNIAEGTVILHLTNMTKLNINLAKSVIKRLKLIKDSFTKISPFFIATCLSLCNVKHCSSEIVNLLKVLVFNCQQSTFKHEHSKWLQQRETLPCDIQKILIDIIERSKQGWDYITDGLIKLGFTLMECYGPKPGAFGRKIQENEIIASSPHQNSCLTGIKILATTFKIHPVTRVHIIEEIFKKVVSEGCNTPIFHYISVLHGICKKYASIMLDTKPKIKLFIEHLHYLSPVNAKKILRSLIPIIRINSNLKDSVILILRKMLFSSEENSRVIAVNGFTLLLQTFKVAGQMSLSQASSQSTQSIFTISSQILIDGASSSFGSQGSNNEPFCLEVLSTLRRCLTQQCAVRKSLYNGIWKVVAKNTGLGSPSLEVLLNHFVKYFEEDEDSLPPVYIEKSFTVKNDVPQVIDSIPMLMSSLLSCRSILLKNRDGFENDNLDDSLNEKVKEIFKGIANRLANCEVEDFDLDKSAEFNLKNNNGKKNGIIAEQVIGVYEIAIEFLFLYENLDGALANSILKLMNPLKRLRQMTQNRKDLANSTTFSPEFLQSILEKMSESEMLDAVVLLKNDEDFLNFILNMTYVSCIQANNTGFMCGVSGTDKKTVQYCVSKIGESCLKLYDNTENSDPVLNLLCLKIFNVCLQFTFRRNHLEALDFLKESRIEVEDEFSLSSDSIVATHLQFFQTVISTIISESPLSSDKIKLLQGVVDVLVTIASNYTGSGNASSFMHDSRSHSNSSTPAPSLVTKMNEWVGKFCSEKEVEDVSTCKALLTLHFDLVTVIGPWQADDKPTRGCECILRDTCKDVKKECGLIDEDDDSQDLSQETTAESSKQYAILNMNVVPHVIPIVVQRMNMILTEMDHILQRLKGQVCVNLADLKYLKISKTMEDEEDEKRRKMESSICPRLATMLIGYQSLIRSALPIGNIVGSVLSGLVMLFNVLKQFTRYYIWLISQSVVKAPSSRYESLIKLVGGEVTKYVYSFIIHVESEQQQRTARNATRIKKAEAGEKAKILRETKAIPPLIYAIETFEHYVILLGKKCNLNLMSGYHLSTSRDFRIKNDIIKGIINSKNSEENEEGRDSDEEYPSKEPRISR